MASLLCPGRWRGHSELSCLILTPWVQHHFVHCLHTVVSVLGWELGLVVGWTCCRALLISAAMISRMASGLMVADKAEVPPPVDVGWVLTTDGTPVFD